MGGKGYTPGYVSKIVVEIPTDNYEFTLTIEPDYHIIGSRVIDWGDGTESVLVDSYSHVYERKGKYTILGNFVLGNSKEPSASIKECLTEVYMMANSVSDLSRAFQYCNNLKVLDFDTSHVTNMLAMFQGCSGLTELDLSNWNTSNVTNMQDMFINCSSLTELDLSNFNTTNVTNMQSMFQDCKSLTSLDLSSFNTSNVINMQNMFYNCSKIVNIEPPINLFISHDIASMIYLTREELLQWLNALSEITTNQTLTLGSTLSMKLRETDLAIATNKGWSIA